MDTVVERTKRVTNAGILGEKHQRTDGRANKGGIGSDPARTSLLSVFTNEILSGSPERPGVIIMSRHSAERSNIKFRPEHDSSDQRTEVKKSTPKSTVAYCR